MRLSRKVSSWLRRSHPQGREARRHAGAGADQVRAAGQRQDCQSPRSYCAYEFTRASRRGDRTAEHVAVGGKVDMYLLRRKCVLLMLWTAAPRRHQDRYRVVA